ncbi:MAG: phytoene desaturase family protein [Myxococcota bacterium]
MTAAGDTDVAIVGAGHNGLVAAVMLARAGLSVRVLEAADVVGGACRTERPFPRAPGMRQSTGAYLLGLMPPELLARLDLELPTVRRDPHYFLPTTGSRYLLLGSDRAEARRQFLEFFSERDFEANQALDAELDALREDVGPTWLEEPRPIEETAERYVRPALRRAFVDLCRGSVGAYLDRFGFRSELVAAMYAVTDGFTGLYGGWDTPGSGMNFLIHNMCRLRDSDGTWMIVEGGMGTVTSRLAEAARRAGARIDTNAEVARIELEGGVARGVALRRGEMVRARAVVVGADPFRLLDLVGRDACPAELRARIDGYRRDGSTLKVNLCLDDLPRFRCLPERRGQHHGTIHLLPEDGEVLSTLRRSFEDVQSGRLPEQPCIEWYIHTPLDPSLSDEAGRHSSALFVQWVPYEPAGSTWDAEESRYVEHLLSICDRFAPDTSSLVHDVFTLTPPKIERHFGMSRGHIHHVDNSFGFADRMPYRTPIEGLYACGAGCHPGGSVIGAAGHNAAVRLMKDLGVLDGDAGDQRAR